MVMHAHFDYEQELWNQGKKYIAGIDEVGRGPWAGPVVAAAVIFPAFCTLPFSLRDSKMLSEGQRDRLQNDITNHAVSIGIGAVSAQEIDTIGISASTLKAMTIAIEALDITPDYYLIDAFSIPALSNELQTPIIKGDAISSSIAAASIIAKTYRDKLLVNLSNDAQYGMYGFEKHKGYGTKFHKEQIVKYGLSDVHRKTFIHF